MTTNIGTFLIKDLWKTIIEYVDGDIDVGFDLNKLDWLCLSGNPSAEYILEKESKKIFPKIDWVYLAYNKCPRAIKIIEENLDNLYDLYDEDDDHGWYALSTNPYALNIIEKHLDKIDKHMFISRIIPGTLDKAVDIIEKNLDKIRIGYLNFNNSDRIMDIIEKNLDKMDIRDLQYNTSDRAIDIIEKNLEKFSNLHLLCKNRSIKAMSLIEKNIHMADWKELSRNPYAINIIEKYLDTPMSQVDWKGLSGNPSAIHIIEKHLDKVDWKSLSGNRSIEAMKIIENNLDKAYWNELSDNWYASYLLEKRFQKYLKKDC